MSTTTITRTFHVGGVLTDVTSCVFSNVAGTIGVRRLDTLANVVAPGTALTHTGLGTYSYTFADPASGLTYNLWVQFVYAGETYWIEQDVAGGTAGGGAATIAKALPASCVSLPRYAEIMEINENWFWGINDNSTMSGACDHIWTMHERNRIARYLFEAQEEIEEVIGYPLCPRWFLDEPHPYTGTMSVFTKWGHVLNVGFENSSVIQAAAPINFATDPAVIGPIATTVTDEDEIVVYHPNSPRTIVPDDVTISGGFVTITIPWCRLINAASFDNPDVGWTYTDMTKYLATVDILRVYNDPSVQGGLVFPHYATSGVCGCECSQCCGTCGDYQAAACEYIRAAEIGVVDVVPGAYANGAWTASCSNCYCATPEYVRLNYQAGLETLTPQFEDAVIRLAHSKMPTPPCGCSFMQEFWTRDRNIPDVLDAARLQNPFGVSDGANFAWRQALAVRLQRGMAM